MTSVLELIYQDKESDSKYVPSHPHDDVSVLSQRHKI